ncbi:MAG: DNA methyltransferase [Devosia sp.]
MRPDSSALLSIETFAASDALARELVATLSPAAGFAQRSKLLRRLHARFEEAKVDNLSTESFKRWASEATGLDAKKVQRATAAWPFLSDDMLDVVAAKVPAHGQWKVCKSLYRRSPDEQRAIIEAYGAAPPTAKPVPSGAIFEPVPGILLECVDAEKRLPELVAAGAAYDCVIADWPYGIDYVSQRGQTVHYDEKLPIWCIEHFKQLVRPGGCIALWCNAESLPPATVALTAAGLAMVVLPWDKVHTVMKGREFVIIACERERPNHPDFTIRYPSLHGQHRLQKLHATPKPPEVMEPLVRTLCPPGGVVLDAFMGTAPVAVAAYRLGRGCHAMELDPEHFQTGCEELQNAIAMPLAA